MRSSFQKGVAIFLSAMLILISVPGRNAVASGKQDNEVPIRYYPAPKIIKRGLDKLDGKKTSLSSTERKISSDLLRLIKPELMLEGQTREKLIREMQSNRRIIQSIKKTGAQDSALVYVYIRMVRGADVNVIKPFVSEIRGSKPDWGLVAAMVDVDKLKNLAELDSVLNIRTVIPSSFAKGSVTSEGDTILGADLARALGKLDGTGIKIGVVSNGVKHIQSAIKSGDIPKDINILYSSLYGDDDEGTAMLEVIHDLAPGASLYFYDADYTVIDYQEAVSSLVSAGCNIIVDDVINIIEPFFCDGDIVEYVNSLQDENVILISAAGNYAKQHYQGNFRRIGKSRFHDFSNGKSKDKGLYVRLPPGGAIDIYLEWNDKYDCAVNDYDMAVFDCDTGWLVDESTNDQYGYGSCPCEYIGYLNDSGRAQDLEICILAYTSQLKNLELYIDPYYGTSVYSNNIVAADSIFGQQAAANVITCGAVDWLSPAAIEPFSSRGPVTQLTGTRRKPDICCVDGVSITGAGGVGGSSKTFFGTSAAAAHVAAIAALVWQNHPELTAADVKRRICANAIDVGSKGFDNTFGYGVADAYYAALDFCKIDFVANGGDKNFVNWTPVNCPMQQPTTIPKRTGYTFTGWYTEPECKTLWDFTNNAVKADMKLYAGWKPATYSISFDLQDGSAPTTISAEYGSKLTEPSPAPTRQGYIFGGWYIDKACKTPWRFDTDLVAGNLTLYAKMVPEKLPAPVGAQQTGSAYDGVTLGWQAVQYADGYEVSRSDTADGTLTFVGTANTNSFTEAGLTFNTSYYYKIRAFYNSPTALYGEYSDVVSAKPLPAAPSLKAVVASYKSVKLTWGVVAQASQYEVYRAASPSGPYQLLATTPASSYLNANVSPGTTYYYKARAFTLVSGTKVYGFYSSVVSAKVTVAVPGDVSAARAPSSSIKVVWGKVTDATKYEVWRCTTSANGSFTLVRTVSAINYTDKKLKAGGTYWYKVRAYRLEKGKKIYGDFSKVVSAKP